MMAQRPSAQYQVLPDLPCLESIEILDRSRLYVLLVIVSLKFWTLFCVIWGFVLYREYLSFGAFVAVGIILALFVWLMLRILSCYWSYKTDQSGITMKGLLRKRFVAWPEVLKVATQQSRMGETILKLTTAQKSIKISPKGFSTASSGDCLVASIWQHLRRLGRADEIVFTEAMESLWREIPKDAPVEMEWSKPINSAEKAGIIVLFLVLIVPLVMFWLEATRKPLMIALAVSWTLALVSLFAGLIFPDIRYMANLVKVGSDGIEVKAAIGKPIRLSWKSIIAAWWMPNCLCLRAETKEIRIPYKRDNKELERLALCVIRHLREQTLCAVPFPARVSEKPATL